jgi:RNA polymerase sigma factor (sigma-70 family)
MEASALPGAPRRTGFAPTSGFLRLRSDEQLVALFRAGNDAAFDTIHDRYRARLLAYSRQMLDAGAAEDAMQDVFMRAHAALRRSSTPISLRAWLYRIAHNRCVDELRRPAPIPSEILPGATPALATDSNHEPGREMERSEELRNLVRDVQQLPEQQRSALLMRELQGLSYQELACALDVSVPAIKSLLLRARTSLIETAAARDTPCEAIRAELVDAHDRGVRASGRARRHMQECDACRSYRGGLRTLNKRFAALAPVPLLSRLPSLLGGGIAAGGLGATAATKVAAIVCCVALVGTAAPEISKHLLASPHHRTHSSVRATTMTPRYVAQATQAAIISPISGGTQAPQKLSGSGAAHSHTSSSLSPLRSGPGTAAAGATAASGATGTSGATGITGASGATGVSGVSGTTGTTGASGATGTGISTAAVAPSATTGQVGVTEAAPLITAPPSGASGGDGVVPTTPAGGTTGASGPQS